MDGVINTLEEVNEINKGDFEIEQMNNEEFTKAAKFIGCEVVRVEDLSEFVDDEKMSEDVDELFQEVFLGDILVLKTINDEFGYYSELVELNGYKFIHCYDNGYNYMLWCKKDLKAYLDSQRDYIYSFGTKEMAECFYDLFKELWE